MICTPHRRHRTVVALVAVLVACACRNETRRNGTDRADPVAPEVPTFEQAWIGRFVGGGRGMAGGMDLRFDDVTLTVSRDADSVRLNGCRTCVTVVLDTVFALSNVEPSDPQRVTLHYVRDGTRRTLELEKFSGGGGTANVVLARLAVRPAEGIGLATDVAYTLEAR